MSESLFRGLFEPLGKRAFVFKITDTAEVTGLNNRKVQTKPQPSDFIVVVDGDSFFAEVKSSKDPTSFPFSNIRPKQFSYARMIVAAGGSYFFFIYRPHTGEWFRVPAQVFLDQTKKSMRWDELKEYRYR